MMFDELCEEICDVCLWERDFCLTLFIRGRPVGLACCHDAKDYPSCSTTMLERATSTGGFLDQGETEGAPSIWPITGTHSNDFM